MTYKASQPKTPTQCTCANCPMFDNYHEPNGKGWCKAFDIAARTNHTMTCDCLSRLRSESKQDLIPEEDRLHCQFNEGNIVKLIDSSKDHDQWENFVVVGRKYNQDRFKTTESYLNEPTWYVLIATVDKPIPDQYWKAETDICHADHSAFIETEEVF